MLAGGVLASAGDFDWIGELGGKVEKDANGNIIGVNLSSTWVNDTELLQLAALPKLERLNLSHTRISDEGLLHLRPCKQISELNLLYAEQITDLGLNAIKSWTNLKRLNVRGTRISDPTLAIVGKLTQLESLDIANTGITEAGLDNLVPLTSLKHLAIGRIRFSEEAMGVIRLLTTLQSLDLSGPRGLARNQRSDGAPVAPAVVRAIAELKDLRMLRLGHSQLDREALETFATSLLKLEKIGLEACNKLDDQAIGILAAWKSLKYADLEETGITAAGVEDLERRRPDLQILSGPFTAPPPKT
jgi:hypothetical protein